MFNFASKGRGEYAKDEYRLVGRRARAVYADITIQVLIYLLSFALLLNGIARLVIGGFTRTFPRWLRGFFVVVGLLTIVLSVFVFVSHGLGFLTLVLILSFTFLFNGIARIVQGITGTQET